jgi:hypothetical protein
MPLPERRSPWPSRAEVLLLLLWSALLVSRFVAVRTWYWHPDEHDNLVAGWLVARGWRLYADVFSHHMPLPYLWVAAMNSLLGSPAPEVQRVAFAVFGIGFLALTFVAFRARISLLTFGALELLYALVAPLFLGHALLADNAFALGAVPLALYLLFPLPLSGPRAALLSAAAFLCVGSTAIAVFPVGLTVAIAAWRTLRSERAVSRGAPREPGAPVLGLGLMPLACIFAAPFAVLLAWLALRGLLGDFRAQAIAFNAEVYGSFLTPPVHHALDPLRNALGEMGALVASAARAAPPTENELDPVARAYFVLDRVALGVALCVLATVAPRRPGRALAWAAFVFLTRLRGGLFHANAFYAVLLFSLSAPIEAIAAALPRLPRAAARLAATAPVLLAALWLDRAVWSRWLLADARQDVFRVKAPQEDLVRALTHDGERIWVAPLDPLFYLDTGRDPASFAIFYLPWQAASPAVAARVAAELARARPPLVVFRGWQPIFGRKPTEYAPDLLRWIEANYVNLGPLAPGNPWLRDLYLERGRYAELFGDGPGSSTPLAPGLRALLEGAPRDSGSL